MSLDAMGIFDSTKQFISDAVDKTNEFLKGTFDKALTSLNPGLGSDWQGLNNHLIARFYPVNSVGEGKDRRYVKDPDELAVYAPILDGAEMEYQLNWQSPFEQMGTEAKAPAISAMLQSGLLSDFFGQFTRSVGVGGANSENPTQNQGAIQGTLKSLEGRTGITKLNSTQTFAGMPPVKCTMKLLFRAYSDPKSEVMEPIKTLIKWAMPQELSPDGALVNVMQAISGEGKWLDVLMPSKAPRLIAMEYKGRIYKPLVIEMISDPITSPTTSDGSYAKAEVSLTISSLTAWDKADIQRIYGGKK